ncbi:unnamed protein product [Allacma fusca]|uniref:Uncharacterized protein n=1 Tax=Allacma fusca TaxID=39272 RepID=A0A8J2JMH0_9HEXA|nr:unnamed protein product [Allacma fusca]
MPIAGEYAKPDEEKRECGIYFWNSLPPRAWISNLTGFAVRIELMISPLGIVSLITRLSRIHLYTEISTKELLAFYMYLLQPL